MKKTKMLKKNYEFRKVLTKGTCYFGKKIYAYIYKPKKQNFNFLGIAISVKTCKAVRRNHIKRLIRESYYHYEQYIDVGNNIIFLLNKKADPQNINFKDIENDMNMIFRQAKIL